jgi:hypothetical protein
MALVINKNKNVKPNTILNVPLVLLMLLIIPVCF